MRVQRALLVAVCGLLVAAAVSAKSKPVAVSPGDASKLVLIGDTCPTFSWGQVDEAKSYKLVVYQVGEEGQEAEPVLNQKIAGSASSWTPPLESCLERGGQYAWSVRAVGAKETSQWSALSLFEVASGPSEREFEQALTVVQQYLEERGDAVDRDRRAERADPRVGAIPSPMKGVAGGAAAETEAPTSALSGAAPAIPQAPATVSLVTEGALGVGTSTPLADLHVVGGDELGGLLLAPNESQSNGSSELFLAEDDDGSYGMKLRYDGSDNDFQILGHGSAGDTEPWLQINRFTGATTFAGLVNGITPDPPCFSNSAYRFVNCGNGTVTDMATGLIWLEDAGCLDQATYAEANGLASALADGQCDLTDGSRTGDWRLPTAEEWAIMLLRDCPDDTPQIVAASGTAFGPKCYSQDEWALNVEAATYWSSTPDVAASLYWGDFASGGSRFSTRHVWPVRGRNAARKTEAKVCIPFNGLCTCDDGGFLVSGGADCSDSSIKTSRPNGVSGWQAFCTGEGEWPSIYILCRGSADLDDVTN